MGFLSGFPKVGFVENYGLKAKDIRKNILIFLGEDQPSKTCRSVLFLRAYPNITAAATNFLFLRSVSLMSIENAKRTTTRRDP